MAYIENYSFDTILSGTSNDDKILSVGSNVTITGGAGNDTIGSGSYYYGGSNVIIDGGTGNDSIKNFEREYVTMKGGYGNDIINNYKADNVTISGGAGNDKIYNDRGWKVSIDAGTDNDYIYSNGSPNSTIIGGKGNDDIHHFGNNSMINGGDGNDTIYSRGNNATIFGGTGSDSIENNDSNSFIDAGNGNDTIKCSNNATIFGGAGNDVLYSYDDDLIIGGAGNDTIYNNYNPYTNAPYAGYNNYRDYVSNIMFRYTEGDGNDIVYGVRYNSTINIATNSGYTSTRSGNDLIIKVGKGKMTFKDGADNSFTIVTEELPEEKKTEPAVEYSVEFRKSSASALNEFIEIGKGTDTVPSYTSKDSSINKLAEKVSKSSIYIVRLIGKIFGEKTKYKLKADGSPETDRNGNPIKDTSPSKTIITAGYNALLNVDSILTSAKKISKGNLSEDKLLKEELNISTQTAALVDNISKMGGDPKAGFITPFGSAAVGLATNVINGFAGGIDKSVVTGFTNNFKTLLTETLKKLDKNPALKDTALGTWLKGKAAGTKIESFVNKIVGKTVVDHIGTAVSSFLGVYSAVTTYLESTEQYNIDGLPDKSATINKTIDVIADGIHSFSNAFVSTATAGILNADTIFTGVYNVAATIKWSFQHGWALATGGDASKVKFQTEDRNFTEIIGDFVKGLVTGTTNAKDVFNEKNKKKIYTQNDEDNQITNFGSQCTINSSVGKDLVFNHEGTKSNYVDAGNDDDTIVAYGTSNSILGGQGNDRIALYSDGKTPAGGNILGGGAGSDQILIDDTAYATLPRKSNNTILGGQGDDLIAIEDTKIPVVLRYKAGDGNDYVFGYDKNDTIQIVNSEYTTKKSGQDVVITIGKGSVTLMGAKGKKLNIEKVTDDSLPKGLSYDKKKTTITASTKFVDEQIDLSNYAATVTKVKASSLVTSVNIVGNSLANELIGGKGSDTLNGGAGKDTLTGGKGNDSIKGGADADILKGEDDNDKLYGEAGNDTLDGGKGNDELYGGAGNDCLVGGKGSDTLTGDKGNDSLWGNAGADTFIYAKGDGQDIIYGFDKTDLLQITGTFSASYSKAKKEIYFDVGTTTNAITLKDFGSTASFNVNGTNYKISGTKLIKK